MCHRSAAEFCLSPAFAEYKPDKADEDIIIKIGKNTKITSKMFYLSLFEFTNHAKRASLLNIYNHKQGF